MLVNATILCLKRLSTGLFLLCIFAQISNAKNKLPVSCKKPFQEFCIGQTEGLSCLIKNIHKIVPHDCKKAIVKAYSSQISKVAKKKGDKTNQTLKKSESSDPLMRKKNTRHDFQGGKWFSSTLEKMPLPALFAFSLLILCAIVSVFSLFCFGFIMKAAGESVLVLLIPFYGWYRLAGLSGRPKKEHSVAILGLGIMILFGPKIQVFGLNFVNLFVFSLLWAYHSFMIAKRFGGTIGLALGIFFVPYITGPYIYFKGFRLKSSDEFNGHETQFKNSSLGLTNSNDEITHSLRKSG